jgi:ATP-dependent exoDNAse (exonuclease V) beta subunit
MFKHDLIELPELIRIDGPKRHYQLPTGERYPSVTTVLSAMSDKSHLETWRNRIGAEEADRQTNRAAERGTAVHYLCENYVLNKPINLTVQVPNNVILFKQLQGFLKNDVDNIRVSEGSLFSHRLKVAGSVDLVADYQGKPAIIDFKTSTRAKKKEWIENYFLQASMYSFMLYEMTKLYHPTIVVAISVEEEAFPQIFVESVHDWLDKARQVCKDYHYSVI